MPDFNQMQRRRLAAKRQAMPDGGFPIRNVADLKNAIQAFGRAKNKPAVKAWIKKRARELGATNLLPDNWRSDTLVHYGIKGMKWGIRRYQNKDGTLTPQGKKHYSSVIKSGGRILKTGTEFQRISSKNETRFPSSKGTWVSHTPFDNDFYISSMSMKLYDEGSRFIYKNRFKNVSDLIVPSHDKQVDMFVDLYKNNKVRVAKDLSKVLVKTSERAQYDREFRNKIKKLYVKRISELSDEKLRDSGYAIFISSYGQTKISDLYRKQAIAEGYNALRDDHDRLYNNSFYNGTVRPEDPLIILNPNKDLRKTGTSYVNYNKDFIPAAEKVKKRSENKPLKRSESFRKFFE